MAMVAAGVACLLTAVLGAFYLREPASTDEEDASAEAGDGRIGALQILAPRYLVGTLMLWLLFVAMLTVSYCLVSWLPTLLVEVGRDRSFAALSITIFSLGGIISALAVGLLIDKWGATPVLVSFLCVAAATLFATGLVLESASGLVLMTLLGTGGFFFLGAYGGVNVVLATYYPPRLRATGIGWSKSVGRIGTVIAPVLIGMALSVGIEETLIMSMFALPAVVAIISLLVIAYVRRSATVLSSASGTRLQGDAR
jgi:sugar phosphate permease